MSVRSVRNDRLAAILRLVLFGGCWWWAQCDGLWGNDGNVSHGDAKTCIRLLGQEVMPAMREIGKELGLKDPFELNAPVHLRHSTDLRRLPQAAE